MKYLLQSLVENLVVIARSWDDHGDNVCRYGNNGKLF